MTATARSTTRPASAACPSRMAGEFDIILAFSVFTHTDWSEMVELVGQLREMLAPSGVLAFTFCDPNYERSSTDGVPPRHPSTEVPGMAEGREPRPRRRQDRRHGRTCPPVEVVRRHRR